jgi:hypothetical protein|tara:strand:+ start:53 stop:553 length:501 start_codon:yes stop_codon:yes gene_type:complete
MKILKSFIDNNYCNILSNWILNKKDTDLFQDANMKGNRLTTRYTKKDVVYPQEAFEIRNKIINHLDLKYFKYAPFTYGMYASVASKGDTCYLHKDARHFDNHHTIHCNLKLNNTEGGDVLVEDKTYSVEKGDLWMYPVSEINHGTNLLTSDNRLIWVYSFCLYANR